MSGWQTNIGWVAGLQSELRKRTSFRPRKRSGASNWNRRARWLVRSPEAPLRLTIPDADVWIPLRRAQSEPAILPARRSVPAYEKAQALTAWGPHLFCRNFHSSPSQHLILPCPVPIPEILRRPRQSPILLSSARRLSAVTSAHAGSFGTSPPDSGLG